MFAFAFIWACLPVRLGADACQSGLGQRVYRASHDVVVLLCTLCISGTYHVPPTCSKIAARGGGTCACGLCVCSPLCVWTYTFAGVTQSGMICHRHIPRSHCCVLQAAALAQPFPQLHSCSRFRPPTRVGFVGRLRMPRLPSVMVCVLV